MQNAVSPKALLDRYGLRPKYSFGQNFLADERLAARIAEACAAEGGSVVELGAGLGALTRPLLASGVSFVRAVFLVQLEVADRLAAAAGSDAYGALSVFAQRAFKVERAFVIRRGA